MTLVTAMLVVVGMVLLSVLGTGCGTDRPPPDVDSGVSAGPVSIPWLEAGEPPVAPPAAVTPAPDEVLDCPDGQAHFFGESACVDVGSPCPAGAFADDLPTDVPVVYVQAGALGGDGSLAAPHGSVDDFDWARLTAGTVVALSAGVHRDRLVVPRGITVRGACTAQTLVSPPNELGNAAIEVVGADVELRDLSIANTGVAGLVVATTGASVRVSGVVISGVEGIGAVALVGALTGESLVIRDTESAFRLRSGWGMEIGESATVDLDRVVIDGSGEFGVIARHPGTSVELSRLILDDTRSSDDDGLVGIGLSVLEGASVTVDGGLVSGSHEGGVFVGGMGSSLVLGDVTVRDTLPNERDGLFGRGIAAQDGATLTIRRAAVLDNVDVGVFVADSSADIEDLFVRGTTQNELIPMVGASVVAQTPIDFRMARARLEENVGGGFVANANGDITIEDLHVSDGVPWSDRDFYGVGIAVGGEGSRIVIQRMILERVGDWGVSMARGGTLELTDFLIRDVRPIGDGRFGRGMNVLRGCTLNASVGIIEQAHDVGVNAMEEASVQLADVIVRDTLPRGCATTTCADTPFGMGMSVGVNARLSATRFAVERASLCGVFVGPGADVQLMDGRVSASAIGACIQDEATSVEQLSRDVRYVDNDVNLDTTTLPLPEPPMSLVLE